MLIDNQEVTPGRRIHLHDNVRYEVDVLAFGGGYQVIDAKLQQDDQRILKIKRQRTVSTKGKRMIEALSNGWLEAGSDGSSRDNYMASSTWYGDPSDPVIVTRTAPGPT